MIKKNSNQCLFCQKYKQDGNFSLVLQKALYCKYSQSQNFFYQRDINDIMGNKQTKTKIHYNDNQCFDLESEYMRRYYGENEQQSKITSLLEYYKFHINIPRNFFVKLINRRMEKIRNIQYRIIKHNLGLEEPQKSKIPQKEQLSGDFSVGQMKNLLKDLKLESTQHDQITNSTILKDLVSQIGNCDDIDDPFDIFNTNKVQIVFNKSKTTSLKLNLEKQIKQKQNKGVYTQNYPKINKPPPIVKIVIPKGSQTSRAHSRQTSIIDQKQCEQITTKLNNHKKTISNPSLLDFAIKIHNKNVGQITQTNFFLKGTNSPRPIREEFKYSQIKDIGRNKKIMIDQIRTSRTKIISPTRQSNSNIGSPYHSKKL